MCTFVFLFIPNPPFSALPESHPPRVARASSRRSGGGQDASARGRGKVVNSGTDTVFLLSHLPNPEGPTATWRGPRPAPTTPPGTAQTLASLVLRESGRAEPAGHSLWNCGIAWQVPGSCASRRRRLWGLKPSTHVFPGLPLQRGCVPGREMLTQGHSPSCWLTFQHLSTPRSWHLVMPFRASWRIQEAG